jgi:hypothetical protein
MFFLYLRVITESQGNKGLRPGGCPQKHWKPPGLELKQRLTILSCMDGRRPAKRKPFSYFGSRFGHDLSYMCSFNANTK